MSITELVQKWVFQIALKKGVVRAAQVVVAMVGGVQVAPVLQQLGISVDLHQLEAGLIVFLTGGLEIVRNYLKFKFKWGWL